MLIRIYIYQLFFFSLFELLQSELMKGTQIFPPKLINSLDEEMYVRSAHKLTLECKAEGDNLEYKWFKDSKRITAPGESGRVNLDKTNVLIIDEMQKSDEGIYYCQVSNRIGEAKTNATFVKMGFLSVIASVETIKIARYEMFQKECQTGKSVPKSEIIWKFNKTEFPSDNRRFISEEGVIYFNYVMPGDQGLYKCHLRNRVEDTTTGSNSFHFEFTGEDITDQSNKPMLKYASGENDNYQVKVLVGETKTLSCFFMTRPVKTDFKYSWTKIEEDGNEVSLVHLQQTYGMTIKLESITERDAGIYKCRCYNGAISSEKEIKLIVESKPLIRRDSDALKSLYVTKGEDAEFNCNPFSIPAPTINWFHNSISISEHTAPPRWSFDGHTKLKVRKAEMNDSRVVACDVANKHARYIYSAVLVVFAPTTIVTQPKNANVSYLNGVTTVSFWCKVKFDSRTKNYIKWWFMPVNTNNYENIHNKAGVLMENDNQTLSITVSNSTDWVHHEGKYLCRAFNGYSESNSSAFLTVSKPISPKESEILQATFAWYLILIAILLILLLMILVCCCCLYKNRGGVYKVDKKERFIGNDPDKELKEGDFKDYQRPSTDYLKGSRASLGSSIPMNSDDEGSLNEYGDIDAGKFGEDGSFIGDYNTERRNRTAYTNGTGVANGNAFNSFGANGYQRV